MCGHIRKLSSLVSLHNPGNKNYSGNLLIWQNKDQKNICSFILDLGYFKSKQPVNEKI